MSAVVFAVLEWWLEYGSCRFLSLATNPIFLFLACEFVADRSPARCFWRHVCWAWLSLIIVQWWQWRLFRVRIHGGSYALKIWQCKMHGTELEHVKELSKCRREKYTMSSVISKCRTLYQEHN